MHAACNGNGDKHGNDYSNGRAGTETRPYDGNGNRQQRQRRADAGIRPYNSNGKGTRVQCTRLVTATANGKGNGTCS